MREHEWHKPRSTARVPKICKRLGILVEGVESYIYRWWRRAFSISWLNWLVEFAEIGPISAYDTPKITRILDCDAFCLIRLCENHDFPGHRCLAGLANSQKTACFCFIFRGPRPSQGAGERALTEKSKPFDPVDHPNPPTSNLVWDPRLQFEVGRPLTKGRQKTFSCQPHVKC